MVFSSLIFLFRFMPIFFLLYFILPMKYKNLCLLIFSLLFYSWGEPKYIILMIASILVDYCISQRIWKEKENKAVLLSGKNKLLQTAFLQKRRQPGAPEPSRSLLKLQHKQVCRQGKSADTDRFLLQGKIC